MNMFMNLQNEKRSGGFFMSKFMISYSCQMKKQDCLPGIAKCLVKVKRRIKMATSKYDELAKLIPELVGGVENVSLFTHCVTRLRFDIKDKSKVDLKEVKKAPGVRGAQWSGDQLQMIIGGGVEEAFDAVCKETGLAVSKSNSQEISKKKFSPSSLIEFIAGCITPIVLILIGSGMLKIIMLLGSMSGLISADSSTYNVLSFVSDSAFYFLPVFIGFSTATKLNMSPYMGALLGAMLLHPNFTALVASGKAISVFGLPVYAASYGNSIFPAILVVFIASYVEKFFKKYSPEVLRSILVPFLTILVMIPLGLCLLAPLGDIIGVYFSKAIIWVYNTLGFVGVALFTGLHPLLVMTGMHHGVSPYLVASLTNPGYEGLASPATVIDNINIGVASAAVALKSKNKQTKTTAIPSAITAIVGGVTEPALFGIVLQYKSVLAATMIGGFVGGAVAGMAKCVSYAFAGSYGLFGLLTFIGKNGMSNLYMMILSVVIGVVVTFVMTMILYKENDEDLEEEKEEVKEVEDEKTNVLTAPISGEVKALSECKDAVFAEGTLGDGVIIEPSEGKVYAPCDGEIASIFNTLHAIGITAANGAEILIHIGMDTVTLNGEGFKSHIKTGDKIRKGQLIMEFDMDFIKSKGLSTTTPVVISNSTEFPEMKEIFGMAHHGDQMIIL